MSEQTPNSSEGLNGAEPSMEDILASIRKIISDDEPVAMESPEDISTADLVETSAPAALEDMMKGIHPDSRDLTSDAVLDSAASQSEPVVDKGESVDLNIDDVLAGLDEDLLVPDADDVVADDDVVIEDDVLSALLDDVDVSTEIAPENDEDILSFLDADIPMANETHAETALVASGVAAIPVIAQGKFAENDDVEMDSLLDDILMTPMDSDDVSEEGLIEMDFSANTSTNTNTSANTTSAEESDLELVKSLMADLADDPDGLETDEDLDALLAIPDVEEESEVEDELAALMADVEMGDAETAMVEPEPEEDILGDILDMTIEDELQTHPDDIDLDDLTSLDAVLDAEQENIAETIDFSDDVPAYDTSVEDLPSLSEIAAAAEADAVAVETAQVQQSVTAMAGLAGGAALGATALELTPVDETSIEIEAEIEAEDETETAETYSEPTTEPISNTEETSMPVKAVKTDAILNEVTETATAGAFAQLNQVVEDKAIFSESGPRIGDLVQDALRPMLKEWLDSNLKGIVERAVAKEVKRISSGK